MRDEVSQAVEKKEMYDGVNMLPLRSNAKFFYEKVSSSPDFCSGVCLQLLHPITRPPFSWGQNSVLLLFVVFELECLF